MRGHATMVVMILVVSMLLAIVMFLILSLMVMVRALRVWRWLELDDKDIIVAAHPDS